MEEYLSISEVVDRLKPEFPDLTASNLRYWEEQGLLSPKRTQGGHRLYSEEDVERIRLIKRLQTKRYYPLAIIRHLLNKKAKGRMTVLEAEAAGEEFLRPLSYDPAFTPLSREELASRTETSMTVIKKMEKIGLLHPVRENGDVRFDEDDLRLVELAKEVVGLGVPLDGLKFYYARLRALVEDELALMAKSAFANVPSEERVAVFTKARRMAAELRAHLYHKIFREVVTEYEELAKPGQ